MRAMPLLAILCLLAFANAFAAAPYKKQTASTAMYDRHTVQ